MADVAPPELGKFFSVWVLQICRPCGAGCARILRGTTRCGRRAVRSPSDSENPPSTAFQPAKNDSPDIAFAFERPFRLNERRNTNPLRPIYET
jgi:hypothetical protein